MNIPPKCSKGINIPPGVYSGMYDCLKNLSIGSSVDAPWAYQFGCHLAAKKLGMTVTTRRLGRKDQITIYRTA
jgi:hypothetical protein